MRVNSEQQECSEDGHEPPTPKRDSLQQNIRDIKDRMQMRARMADYASHNKSRALFPSIFKHL
jgi:hypothetical protein